MTELDDSEIWAIESLGRFFLLQERYHRAATIFHALSKLRPDRPYAWYGLAVLHERGGDPDTALRCFARAVESSQRAPAYVLLHAEALLRQGDHESASPLLAFVAENGTEALPQRATTLRTMRGR